MNIPTADETLKKVPEDQIIDSVFDFLYHDGRRVASLLAQFDPSGHLQSVATGRAANEGKNSDAGFNASGGLPGFAKISGGNKEHITRSHTEEIQRVYDPMWSNARALLDTVDENGMMQRDLAAAKIGQLVLVTGELSVFDLGLVSGLWALPTVQKQIESGLPEVPTLKKGKRETIEARASVRLAKLAREQAELGYNLFREMAPMLPHTTQAHLTETQGQRLWCTLNAEGLSMPPSEIVLKHGTTLPGEWAMLGILDALPDTVSLDFRNVTPDGAEMVTKVFESMAPALRTLLGRPEDAYGVTPLMIFREISH